MNVKNNWVKMTEAEFAIGSGNVVKGMDGNTHFSSLQSKVDVVKAQQGDFVKLLSEAKDGSRKIILKKNNLRSELTGNLKNLGICMLAVAGDNDELKLESGFPLTGNRQPTPPLQTPVAPKLELGTNDGELLCTAKKQKGVTSVNYYISLDQSTWQITGSNKSKFLFTGLEGGKLYYVKYELIGVKNQRVMSNTLSFRPQ